MSKEKKKSSPAQTTAKGKDSPWMPAVTNKPKDCPKGLEYLSLLDQVLVQQKTSLLEAVTGFEAANKYVIKNNQGQNCYYAFEESNCCCRQCFGRRRQYTIVVTDQHQTPVFTVHRPCVCCTCGEWACSSCVQDGCTVNRPDGELVGYVEQACSYINPRFIVYDEDDYPRYEITGRCWICECCCPSKKFQIKEKFRNNKIGYITKQWSGLLKEAFTDSDNFSVTCGVHSGDSLNNTSRITRASGSSKRVKKDIAVELKATLIGALFLLDFRYFEDAH